MKNILALAALAAPMSILAHEGHGLPGVSHWHADDVLVVLGAVAVATVVWLSRRGK